MIRPPRGTAPQQQPVEKDAAAQGQHRPQLPSGRRAGCSGRPATTSGGVPPGMATEHPLGCCAGRWPGDAPPQVRSSYPAGRWPRPQEVVQGHGQRRHKAHPEQVLWGPRRCRRQRRRGEPGGPGRRRSRCPRPGTATTASAPGGRPGMQSGARAVGNRSVKDTASITPRQSRGRPPAAFPPFSGRQRPPAPPAGVDSPAARDSNSARTAAIPAYSIPRFLGGTATIPHRPGFSRAKFLGGRFSRFRRSTWPRRWPARSSGTAGRPPAGRCPAHRCRSSGAALDAAITVRPPGR